MLYYYSLLYPQIPNSTSTSVHQGLALFSYVLIAIVDIREKHLKLLLRKLTYMTWSISKSTFFFFFNFTFPWFIRGKIIGKVTLKNTYLLPICGNNRFQTILPLVGMIVQRVRHFAKFHAFSFILLCLVLFIHSFIHSLLCVKYSGFGRQKGKVTEFNHPIPIILLS